MNINKLIIGCIAVSLIAALVVYSLFPKLKIAHISVVKSINGQNALGITDAPSGSSSRNGPAVSSPVKPVVLSGASFIPATVYFGRHPGLVSQIGSHSVEYPGQFAKASVRVDGKTYQLTPNQLGTFPQVMVGAKDRIQVQVSYPNGQAGDPVVVEAEDGGTVNGKTGQLTSLDGQKSAQFNFTTTEQPEFITSLFATDPTSRS